MQTFWISLGLTFLSEMGDKTQLLALAYATRYRIRDVLLGIVWGTAVIHLASVGLGNLIGLWLPLWLVQTISALSFLGFAVWTFLEEEDATALKESPRHPILFIGLAFIIAEIGDKTMLTAVTLATTRNWLSVWVGTTLGMISADVLAVGVGHVLGRKIPKKLFGWMAAAMFLGFALWTGIEAWRSFKP